MDSGAIKRSLADGGLRCTPQRYAVMAFLMQQAGHPAAVEIFEAVNRVDPRSSRATIYNNLRDLVQAGLVREVAMEGRAARFDAKGLPQHRLASGCFANANSFSGGCAASAFPGALPAKYQIRMYSYSKERKNRW